MDSENWKNISGGFLLGFHNDRNYLTIDNCTECIDLGKQIALLNKGFVFVEQNKDQWVN